MRYLEILLAGLIFFTSYVIGNVLPPLILFQSTGNDEMEVLALTFPGTDADRIAKP